VKRAEFKGGDRVLVGEKRAVVVKCERTFDKAARRGRRTFLVRYEDGTEGRVSAAAMQLR
jgi:hypothetical protein